MFGIESADETQRSASLQPVTMNYPQYLQLFERGPELFDESVTEIQQENNESTVEKRSRKRVPRRRYHLWHHFSSLAEFNSFWEEEKKFWLRRRRKKVRRGNADFWNCWYSKRKVYDCQVSLRVFFSEFGDYVTVEKSEGEHDHQPTPESENKRQRHKTAENSNNNTPKRKHKWKRRTTKMIPENNSHSQPIIEQQSEPLELESVQILNALLEDMLKSQEDQNINYQDESDQTNALISDLLPFLNSNSTVVIEPVTEQFVGPKFQEDEIKIEVDDGIQILIPCQKDELQPVENMHSSDGIPSINCNEPPIKKKGVGRPKKTKHFTPQNGFNNVITVDGQTFISPTRKCPICEIYQTQEMHYGLWCCEPCRIFWYYNLVKKKRSGSNMIVKCKNFMDHVVDKGNEQTKVYCQPIILCTKCRMRKCEDLGMKIPRVLYRKFLQV